MGLVAGTTPGRHGTDTIKKAARVAGALDLLSGIPAVFSYQYVPGALIVRAELNESLVDHVKIGMRAEVVSAGDEGQVHTAQVVRVGELFGPSRLGDDARDGTDARSVECLLKLDASTLRIGQRVLVRFLP